MPGLRALRRGTMAPHGIGYQTPTFVQSAATMAATGAATATLSSGATAGNLLIAVIGRGSGTTAIAGSGWTLATSFTSGVATARIYTKVAAGGETTESSNGAGTVESIQFIEYAGVTATVTGTPVTVVDDAATHNSLAIGATSPTVPALLFSTVVSNGSITSPSWTVGGLTLLDHTQVHSGYLAVAAGSYAATLTFTGTARRVGGASVAFTAKTA